MANEIWDKEIDMSVDWGGDSSTGGLPVSGAQVQAFIKKQLNSKGGVYYEDEANDRYLVFASEDTKQEYLADPDNGRHLILGIIKAGGGGGGASGSRIKVNLLSPYYMAVLPGAKNTAIEFTFETLNESGMPTGEDVFVTFTFRWNAVVKEVRQKYSANSRVRFVVDDYVGEAGITNINVKVEGATSFMATQFGVVYNKIDLELSDTFKVGTTYNLVQNPNANLEFPFFIKGNGLKTLEWFLDNTQLIPVKSEDEVTEAATNRVKYIKINTLSEGLHRLQVRAFVTINGERFYSQTLYREFVVYKVQNTVKTYVAIGADLGIGSLVNATSEYIIDNLKQYEPYNIRIGVFNPAGVASNTIGIQLNNQELPSVALGNGVEHNYVFTPTTSGPGKLKFTVNGEAREIPVEIDPSSMALTEITEGLALALSATGKSNDSGDRDQWRYGNITTDFTNFAWNAQQGWSNNRLAISGDARVTVNYAPLGSNAIQSGKTIELEFSASQVVNDNAVICDLRSGNIGMLITASEVSLTSATGASVSAKYKVGENIRVAFVINRASGVADKQLAFIYINGILSGAVNYPTSDNFQVNKNLVFSSPEATLHLKEIRVYDLALSPEQILNNYMLYRDTASEMLTIYDRNNIFTEGTSEFSIDALTRQLPVMVITGNVPALEATTNKNLQIIVDVEYTNLQDPTRSFTMKNAAMRPQGTSSMSYPKKNFRLYTEKVDNTEVYDANGNIVANKLYSFKQGAQPVNCWCMKADYAESSSTHNTGVARLWNTVMKNTQIDGEYKLRTKAQEAAIKTGYKYDVRTTIDGFPILMFYRLDANSPLVFIGKYNFNNDKSTESVFGFRDIPGFDSSKVECWEVLNNGHHLALFQDVANWASAWYDAFEGRYPDGNTDSTQLKNFATWLVGVKNNPSAFATQKWDHLDVYKVAAYYIYLLRFGAVDQVVKNAMFTTEDGVHWFYINYDNDTVNGLRNDGLLIYPPTIDRQTLDSSFGDAEVYAYAGHDSVLWNMLEADDEFMQIVTKVDNALYTAGLSYAEVINMFDNEQSNKWCERIYNQDAQYKYVGPFRDNGINNLFMLQGSRQSHRRWWLSKRFNLIDGKFVSGAYKDNVFEVKLAGAPIGLTFSIVAGLEMAYGYGVNNIPIQYGITLNNNQSHTFETESVLNVGDPLRLYAAPNIKEIDVHNFSPYLSTVNMAGVASPTLGSALEKLVVGGESITNNALYELSGIANATRLKYLDIRGYKALSNLDLTASAGFETLLASKSGLTSIALANGAPVKRLDLPSSLTLLSLHNLPVLIESGLTVESNMINVVNLSILNCPRINSKTILDLWLENKNTPNSDCSIELDGIEWNTTADYLLSFKSFRNISFKGRATISAVSESQISELSQLFGPNCFESGAEFYITLPAGSSVIAGPSEVDSNSVAQYAAIVSGKDPSQTITWSVAPLNPEISISNNGVLTVGFLAIDTAITVRAQVPMQSGAPAIVTKIVAAKRVNAPVEGTASIEGPEILSQAGNYSFKLRQSGNYDKDLYYITWRLDTSIEGITIASSDDSVCVIKYNGGLDTTFNLEAVFYLTTGQELFTVRHKLTAVNGQIIATLDSNEPLILCLRNAGIISADASYLTAERAAEVTDFTFLSSLASTNNGAFISEKSSFDEFQYFTKAPAGVSLPGKTYKSVTLPASVNTITALTAITLNTGLAKVFKVMATLEINNFIAPYLEELITLVSSSTGIRSISKIHTINIPNLKALSIPQEEAYKNAPIFRTAARADLNIFINAVGATVSGRYCTLISVNATNTDESLGNIEIIMPENSVTINPVIVGSYKQPRIKSILRNMQASNYYYYTEFYSAAAIRQSVSSSSTYFMPPTIIEVPAGTVEIETRSETPRLFTRIHCKVLTFNVQSNSQYNLSMPKLKELAIYGTEAPTLPISYGKVISAGTEVTGEKRIYLKEGAPAFSSWPDKLKTAFADYTVSYTL